MIEIRIHGRGGQGARLASRIIGRAGFLAGLYVQDFPLFGAERRGAPIVACARLSRDPIETRGYVEEPDLVVVMDDTLLQENYTQILGGLRAGAGVLIDDRSNQRPLPATAPGVFFISINLSGIARRVIGRDTRSAVVGGAAAKFIPEITADILTAAIRAELAEVGVSTELVEGNIKAAMESYALMPAVFLPEHRPPQHKTAALSQAFPRFFFDAYAAPTIRSAGNAALRHTGNWRTERPEIELAKCKKCFLCFLFCPDSAIHLDSDLYPHIDYDHCKGCMICREECPTDAIVQRLEG
ncbi:MAG: hypothetical protein A3F90_01030 [Deltaproteobacteria bacterium RIFCSPLOWO2_12_FULL_60_19]|nr:MAG: hypothetical protein A3F90_01030 [Deltaproteobacteria bacterium RIFCSPLOWO2_12_FULL_60_19]